MTNQVALIIIYNHRYDQNIEPLENLYKNRFSHIFHLVPFYDGDKKNVIPIYENSIYYQGYMAQGLRNYFSEHFTHYIFIGDDVFLNPAINESNYHKVFQLNEEISFLPGYIPLHETSSSEWPRVREAYDFRPKIKGAEIDQLLPGIEDAKKKFINHNLELKPLTYRQIYKKPRIRNKQLPLSLLRYSYWQAKSVLKPGKTYNLSYPLVGSFTDLIIVSSKSILPFCQYCGCFAVMELFHELAIPTALVLAADDMVTEANLNQKGKTLWNEQDMQFLQPYRHNLNELIMHFPENLLYVHPVKLSQWSFHDQSKSHQ